MRPCQDNDTMSTEMLYMIIRSVDHQILLSSERIIDKSDRTSIATSDINFVENEDKTVVVMTLQTSHGTFIHVSLPIREKSRRLGSHRAGKCCHYSLKCKSVNYS